MNDDGDLAIIKGLFGAGIGLALAGLLGVADGDYRFALMALGAPLLGLAVVVVIAIVRGRPRPTAGPAVGGHPTSLPSPRGERKT